MRDPDTPLDLSSINNSIGYLLRRASRRLREATVPVLKSHELSPLELTSLTLIRQNPDCILRTLADAVGVEPPAMNRLANSLEAKGLIARRKSESDARYTYFSVLPAGEACMEAAAPEVMGTERDLLDTLPEAERDALFSALRKLAT